MNKNKVYYLLVFISMVIYSFSAFKHEAYIWLIGTIWYIYYLKKWYPVWK